MYVCITISVCERSKEKLGMCILWYHPGNNYHNVNRVNLVLMKSFIANQFYYLKINLHGIEVSYIPVHLHDIHAGHCPRPQLLPWSWAITWISMLVPGYNIIYVP